MCLCVGVCERERGAYLNVLKRVESLSFDDFFPSVQFCFSHSLFDVGENFFRPTFAFSAKDQDFRLFWLQLFGTVAVKIASYKRV